MTKSIWYPARMPSKGLVALYDQSYHDGWVRSIPNGTAAAEGVFGLADLKALILRDEDALSARAREEDIELSIGELAFVYLRNPEVIEEVDFFTVYAPFMTLALDSLHTLNAEKHAALAWVIVLRLLAGVSFETIDHTARTARELGVTFDMAVPYLMEGVYDMALVRRAVDSGVDASMVGTLG